VTQVVGNTNIAVVSDHELHERETLLRMWTTRRGIVGFLTATDHKIIGLRFIITAMVFFCLAGILALLMRIQLAVPNNTFLGPHLYNQLFTTHGSAMMFLFAVPIMEGFGIYLVPLMVGTRNVAFPRLIAFGYWTYLFAGMVLFGALLFNAAPDVGWFAYTPLSGPDYGVGKGVDFWSQMVTLVEIASMSGAIAIITTAFKLRAPGMSLNRIPLFVWASIVASFMVLFAMPAVTLCSTMLSMDRLTHVSTHFYNSSEGGDHLLWQHLFWFFGHPDVYIIFIPATGFVSTIIPTFSRRKVFGYTPLVLSLIATGFIGFGLWVHHMFVTPLPELGQGMFTAASMIITIPSGVQIFCWTATLWGGRVWLKTPLLFVLGFFAIFILGGLTGVMLASVTLDSQAHDTMFVVAHLHYVLIGGAVFPLFAAFHFWYPKWTGRLLSERLGHWMFALMFIGFNLTFYPLHHLGLGGMTRRIYTYRAETGWAMLNHVASSGAALMGIAVLLFLINVWRSRRHGIFAGSNPWGASTLEWATSSPPPPFNFQHLPTAQGRDPLWDNAPDAAIVTGLSTDKREMLVTTALDAVPHHRYEVSHDSFLPLLVSLSIAFLLIVGGIFNLYAVIVGCVAMFLFLGVWFWRSAWRSYAAHHPEVPNPTMD
jgi:cytochrome c oxidase subunit I+III